MPLFAWVGRRSPYEGPALKPSVRGAPPHSLVAQGLGSGFELGGFGLGSRAEELLAELCTLGLFCGVLGGGVRFEDLFGRTVGGIGTIMVSIFRLSRMVGVESWVCRIQS